jgi:outer membrane lipoprotein-sorting protein
MTVCRLTAALFRAAVVLALVIVSVSAASAQQIDTSTLLSKIDAAVKARQDGIDSYTVTEHYAVFRGKDKTHPAAEMTVKTTYKRESGKSYQILSESGSSMMRVLVLHAILDNEKHVNQPGVREGSWVTTANYEMKVMQGGIQKIGGRSCVAVSLTPRRKEPYLLNGTLWVDAKSGGIVQIQGKASKSSSIFAGTTHMMRQYVDIDGYGEATHARAEADSSLFGQTVVTVDYRDYQMQLRKVR